MSVYNSSSSSTSSRSGYCTFTKGAEMCDCDNSGKDSTTLTAKSGDTIHYISPASPLSARTVNEGDYDYRALLKYFPMEEFPILSYASTSTISCVEENVQRTLAIVRPHAMAYEDVILRGIFEAGFAIIHKRHIHLTPEQVSEIYAKHYGSSTFPHMVVSMSIGPILSLCLMSVNAVGKWKRLVGPDRLLRHDWFYPMSMRVRFGLVDDIHNAVHASETLTDATKENIYFYPENIIEPIITEEDKVTDYLNLYVNPTLLNSLTELVKVKPQDPVVFLAQCLLINNPYQPKLHPEIASSHIIICKIRTRDVYLFYK